MEQKVKGLENEAFERKQAGAVLKEKELKLRMSERALKSILTNSPDIIYHLDPKGTITYVNDTVKEYGYSRKDLIGKNILEFVHPDDREKAVHRIDERRTGDRSTKSLEIRLLRKDFAYAHFEAKSRGFEVLSIDAEGIYSSEKPEMKSFVGTQGIARDILERKQVERTLRESEALLRMAGRTARFGGWSTHLDGHEVVWSEQVALIHEKQPGYSPTVEEAIQYYAPEWRDKIAAAFQICIREGTPYDEELEIITAGDNRLWVRTTGEPVRDNMGKIVGVQGSFQDINERKRAEQALKNNQIFLKRIINQSPFATWISDEKGTMIKCNAALKKVLNITDEQLIGKYNVFEDEVAIEQGLIPKIRTVFEDGKTANFSVEWDADELGYKDAKKVHIEGTMFPIHDDKGDLTNVVNHWIDITERKRAEEESRESLKRYQLIVENISNVVWTMDMNFHNTFVSPSVYQQRGYTPEEVKNKPLSERMNPNSIEKVLNLYNKKLKLIEAGDSEGWKPVEFEIEQPCKDGSTIWTTNTVRFLPGPDKQPASLLGTTHDITERKRAEEALRESEDKFRSFAEQSLVGIYLISGDVFKYVNPKFAEMFGYSVNECLDNMHFPQLVHPEDLATVEKQVGKRLSGETKAVRYCFRGIKKGGETIHVEIFGSSMVLKGKTVVTGTMLNITERKRAEEALRESESFFSQIFEQSTTSTCLYNPDGTINSVNNEFCKMFGVEEKVIINAGYNVFKDQATMDAGVTPLLREVFDEKKAKNWETIFDLDVASASTGMPASRTGKIFIKVFGYPIRIATVH